MPYKWQLIYTQGRTSCVGLPRATKIAPHRGAALDIVIWISTFLKF